MPNRSWYLWLNHEWFVFPAEVGFFCLGLASRELCTPHPQIPTSTKTGYKCCTVSGRGPGCSLLFCPLCFICGRLWLFSFPGTSLTQTTIWLCKSHGK